ncbi:DctP family TRAP transporter solute-binding subunit [Bacillaceae bacterium IKA-2]|nr:DctP family TRAP transporter solute-binding subunit [Bacillaceae bacterium IKA-2]
MKSFLWIKILLMLIVTIGFFLTINMFATEELFYDGDQEGLNEQIVIRFSHVVAENTPKGLAAQRFAEIINEKSAGRVRVEVFPNGALFSDSDEFSALVQNDIEMIAPSFSKMTEIAPEWELFDLPFLFERLEDVEEVFTGEIGEHLLSKLNKKGVKGLSLWSNGFKQMTSSQKPLVLPEDFKNQNFRIMPSRIIEKQFRILNANPIAIPFNDVYNSLETFEIDGQENTISNIYSRRWYELQRFMTISNHGYLGYTVMMNGDFWNELPADIQMQMTEAMTETTKWILQESKRMNNELLSKIEKEFDIKIHYLTEEEKRIWKETLEPVYQLFIAEANPGLVELVEKLN